MNRNPIRGLGWRHVAAAGVTLASVAITAVPSANAASGPFYVYSTDNPGKIDGINTSLPGGVPTVPVVSSPTTKLTDLATQWLKFDSSLPATQPLQQLWGIRNQSGNGANAETAALFKISNNPGGTNTSTFVADITGNALMTAPGQGLANGPNALVINPLDNVMYTGGHNSSFAYTVCYLASSGCGTLGAVTQLGSVGFGTNFNVVSGGTVTGATVTTEGDYEFINGIMYATLNVRTGGGQGTTYLATINTTGVGGALGSATLLGQTNSGNTNVAIDGLALGTDGSLWGLVGHDIYTINTTSGALTLKWTISSINTVGATGIVPEPASLAVLGTGLAGLWAARRRKRRAA